MVLNGSSLGDPSWWQAFAGAAQALLAFAIFWATLRYVRLTKELVQLQAEIVKLQKQGERRELYDRRLKLYKGVMGFLGAFTPDFKIDTQAIIQLYRDTSEAEFLFDVEIANFIKEMAGKAGNYKSLRPETVYQLGDLEKIARVEELQLWLGITAFDEAKRKFGQYLRLVDYEPTETAPLG